MGPPSGFAGFRFPAEVSWLAVRWYLRYGLSYRDVEELLGERGVEVDHVSVYRWVQRFTPLLVEAARPCRHSVGDRWCVDETYLKLAGVWRYLYRAIDQFGQVVDVWLSPRRDALAARRFFATAVKATGTEPAEVVTHRSRIYPGVLDDVLPGAFHNVEQYANQQGRGRSRSAQGAVAAYARIEAGPLCSSRRDRPCLGPEPATGPLRARRRGTGKPTVVLPSQSSPWPSDRVGARGDSATKRIPPRSASQGWHPARSITATWNESRSSRSTPST